VADPVESRENLLEKALERIANGTGIQDLIEAQMVAEAALSGEESPRFD
jgi:hypothetical protein